MHTYGKDAKTHAEELARVFVAKALRGDVASAVFVADRAEGKPTQRVEGDLLGLNALADRLQKARQRKLKGAGNAALDAPDDL